MIKLHNVSSQKVWIYNIYHEHNYSKRFMVVFMLHFNMSDLASHLGHEKLETTQTLKGKKKKTKI